MKTFTVEQALISLYNATRTAPLPLEEHDNNRACTDILAQALNLKLEWTNNPPAQDNNNQDQAEVTEAQEFAVEEVQEETPVEQPAKKKKKRS